MLMSYTLSKLLIAALLSSQQALAQGVCGHIGDNNEVKLSAQNSQTFYLDMGNPACCTGTITSWRVCYYGPNPRSRGQNNRLYTVKYAVYRRLNGTQNYTQVSNITFSATLRGSLTSNSQQPDDGIAKRGFNCYDKSLNTSFTVEEGDIIGACVVNPCNPPGPKLRQLNVVSDAKGQSNVQLRHVPEDHNYIDLCKMNTNLPATIDFNQVSSTSIRRLHLSASISK